MIEVVAALIWDKDNFMICQRPADKARGLLWKFVGGRLKGPSKRTAAQDEAFLTKLRHLLECQGGKV